MNESGSMGSIIHNYTYTQPPLRGGVDTDGRPRRADEERPVLDSRSLLLVSLCGLQVKGGYPGEQLHPKTDQRSCNEHTGQKPNGGE